METGEKKFPIGIRIPVWMGVVGLVIWALNSFLSWWSPLEAVINNQVGETPSWFFFRDLPAMICGAPIWALAVLAVVGYTLYRLIRR